MNPRRKPRFDKVQGLSPIQLTGRDRQILFYVNRYRFLRSSHICSLVRGSEQQILRRLQMLFHQGYLERPRAQIDYFHRAGSKPMVYGLGNRGIAALRQKNSRPCLIDWSWKNRSAGRVFLDHALLVSDIMVGIELACRRNSRTKFLHAEELALPGRGTYRWSVAIDGHQIGIVPDQTFAIQVSENSKTWTVPFFLEADTGTMPASRESLRQSSVAKKFAAYHTTWKDKKHRTALGLDRFRVLTVTTSSSRASHLLEIAKEFKTGQGLFLLADSESLLKSDPLEFAWLSPCNTGRSRLMD